MAYTDPATWVAGNVLPASDLNTYVRDDLRFMHDQGGDLAAASTITPTTQFHKVTGNTQVNNITPFAAGARLILWFTGTPVVKHLNGGSGQIRLKAGVNHQVVANDVLQFVTDGTDWYQVGPWLGEQTDYQEWTSGVNVTATSEATATTIVTGAAVTYDGITPILIEFFCPQVVKGTNNITLVLYDGSSSIGKLTPAIQIQTANNPVVFATRRLTPAAAAKTYSIRGFVDAGTGTATGGAGGTGNLVPGYIRQRVAR